MKHVLSKHAGSLAELGVYHGHSSALLSFYAIPSTTALASSINKAQPIT